MLNESISINGSDIRRIRERLGLTQAQLGTLLNAHFVTVSRWETDQLKPDHYQEAMLREFKKASAEREIKNSLKSALIGAGVAAALYLILSTTRK